MITILYSGVSNAGTGRVWGYFYDNTEPGIRTGNQYYVFWGHKDGSLRFGYCYNNAEFHKDMKKKIKRYEPYRQTEKIESEYGQYRTARKLRANY